MCLFFDETILAVRISITCSSVTESDGGKRVIQDICGPGQGRDGNTGGAAARTESPWPTSVNLIRTRFSLGQIRVAEGLLTSQTCGPQNQKSTHFRTSPSQDIRDQLKIRICVFPGNARPGNAR